MQCAYVCEVFFSNLRPIGSRSYDCDFQSCMQRKLNKNKNKERGEVMILMFSHYYILSIKTHSKHAQKFIYIIFTKNINSIN